MGRTKLGGRLACRNMDAPKSSEAHGGGPRPQDKKVTASSDQSARRRPANLLSAFARLAGRVLGEIVRLQAGRRRQNQEPAECQAGSGTSEICTGATFL